jgi:RNA polymerase sigma-70 factor (family 1)
MIQDGRYQNKFSLQQEFIETNIYAGSVRDKNESSYKNIGKKVSTSVEPSEEIQIVLLNAGNKSAFTNIYNHLYPYAFFFARKFVAAEDAADIVATVFIKFWLIPHKQFANLFHIRAFLRVCIRNACLTHIRTENTRIRKSEDWLDKLTTEIEETDETSREEIHAHKMQRIYDEIEKLPARCKQVFKMCYLDNYKNNQVADKLGISTNTVKNHKIYALKLIRIALLSPLSILFTLLPNFI